MTIEEQRNRLMEIGRQYAELYNTDVEKMARELYAPDFEVVGPGVGTVRGADAFIRVEKAILRRTPERQMRLDRIVVDVDTDTVVVEGVNLNSEKQPGDHAHHFIAVLVCQDGKIVQDRTYVNHPAAFGYAYEATGTSAPER